MTDTNSLPGSGPGGAGDARRAPSTPTNSVTTTTIPAAQMAVDPDAPRHVPVPRSLYPIILAAFCLVLIISNITATKGVELGPIVTDGAFFLFPLSYIIGDVLSEVYGFKAARRAVWTGFILLALAMICFQVAIWLPGASFYGNQEAFASVLGTVPQLALAGLAGYVVGQLLNAWSLVLIKKRTGEGNMWARLIGSTVVGELGDTLIFCAIAASAIGISTWADFLNYLLFGYVWKTFVEVICLPVTYPVIGWVKRREGYWELPARRAASPA